MARCDWRLALAAWLACLIAAVALEGCGHRAGAVSRAGAVKTVQPASGSGSAVGVTPSALSVTAPSASTAHGALGLAWPVGSVKTFSWKQGYEAADLRAATIASCDRFAGTPYALSDAPSEAELGGLVGCDAEALYYGIGVPVDFERARKCAYTRAEPSRDAVMGGAEILMMIYANGRGVPKNFELALRFACIVGGAPAELDGRLSRLLPARGTGNLDGVMDMCDDVTSGYMSGYCAAHVERINAVPRNARKHAATTHMPRAEVKALEEAAARFFSARSTWEVDLTGTMRAVFSIEEQATLEDELVVTLEHLQDATFAPPHQDPKALEQELSNVMRLISRKKESPDMMVGAVTASGIRKTQQQWLLYRNKLLALVRKVRPVAELDDWRAAIVRARVKQLRELAGLDTVDAP